MVPGINPKAFADELMKGCQEFALDSGIISPPETSFPLEKHLEVGLPKMFRTSNLMILQRPHNILQAEAEMTHDLIYGFQDH